MKRFFEIWFVCVLFLTASSGTEVSIKNGGTDNVAHIQLEAGDSSSSYRIDASTTLSNWWPIYADPGPTWGYYVAEIPPPHKQYFFQVTANTPPTVRTHETWKNTIEYPDDDFQLKLQPSGFGDFSFQQMGIVKFIILLDDLNTVYFQDSESYNFHYNFAKDRIEQFSKISSSEFNQKTQYSDGLEAIIGNVIFAPNENEYGIQFIAQDVIPRETIRFLYQLVDSSISKPQEIQGFYIPSYQQTEIAEANELWFSQNQIQITSLSKWEVGNYGYTDGWAVGNLVYVPGDKIEEAYENGSLTSNDILLTENLPSEVPYVQGIISLTPASANSHVAILAEASGIPFGYVSDSDLENDFLELIGEEIILGVSTQYSSLSGNISVRKFPSALPVELRQEVYARKQTPEVEIQAIERLGEYAASVDLLTPADIKHFGGKASNFGFLRRSIPDNSPETIAVSFDLWLDFLEQDIDGEKLEKHIDNLLGKYTWPISNLPQLKADLDQIRDLIKDETTFTSEQEFAIFEALSSFDSGQKIRFRSSTNVEDSQNFVGAGLYDSYSGCLLDDLDDDDLGPSQCDSSKEEERGVLRAIRKVYASFYNDNAFLERLRHAIDESKVGMALLIHHSFPDEQELANGVARVEYSNQNNYRQLNIYLTTQVGADSVTNPNAGMVPEIIHCQVFSSRTYCYVNQRSNLLPLGESYVLEWQSDYLALSTLLQNALEEYLTTDPEREELILDFEYKKLAPDNELIVKQIREIPQNKSGEGLPWIMDSSRSSSFRIHQGEDGGDVFAIHRLKSQWNFSGKNQILNDDSLTNTLLSRVELEYINENGGISFTDGVPANWKNASFESGTGYSILTTKTTDSWTQSTRESENSIFALTSTFQTSPSYSQSPIITVEDFSWVLNVAYENPLITIDQLSNKTFGTTVQDYVTLELIPSEEIPSNAIPRQHNFISKDKEISFDIKHWWPDGPGPVNGYTAPLLQWERTIITGLTSSPITLTSYYSQTYKPEHHNFGEWFLFEPALEESLSEEQRQELENTGIHQLVLFTDDISSIWSIDPQGNVTEL